MEEILKSCITCRTPKDASRDFQQQKNECKACARQRYQERREKELASEQNKTCIHCATIGPVDQFLTLKNICRACNDGKQLDQTWSYHRLPWLYRFVLSRMDGVPTL